MFDLVTIGDIKLDTFVVLNDASVQCNLKMPECQLCMEHGGKVAVDVVDSQIAGSAPNVATGLSRLGLKTAVVSLMGEDGTRQMALEKLKKEGVSTKFVRTAKGVASAYSVVINFKGERTILTSHVKRPYHLPPQLKTKWLYASEMGHGYDRLYKEMSRLADAGTKIALNPGSVQLKERKPVLLDLIRRADVLFVNVEEARLLAQSPDDPVHHLAPAVWKMGPKHLVITDGRQGAYYFDGASLSHYPVYPGKRVEATGAGDAFATGFLGALLQTRPALEAMLWGLVNSASIVGQVGPTAGLLTPAQIRSRLRKRTIRPRIL